MHLPAGPKERQITRLLTVLSQALRSRSQDLVRETMCRIVIMLGPSYLSYAVSGPQPHVLAYVIQAIISYVTCT